MISVQPALRSTSSLKVLILTASSGNGHNAAADAFSDWANYLLGDGVEIKIEHLLENSSPILAGAVDFYNYIQCHAPWFHHVYYNFIELQELLNPGTVSLGRDYYIQLLQEFQPDVILSVHDSLNKGYFELAKKILSASVRCMTYCLEFQGGYGFSRNWVNHHTDLFWAPTAETARAAISGKLQPEKVKYLGNILPREFYQPPLENSQKIDLLVNKLGLQSGIFTLLLATGGAGAENHLMFLKSLYSLKNKIQLIVLCGNNEYARQQVQEWHDHHADMRVSILPFTKAMSDLMQVSDAIVTRPGGRTSCEALHLGCPVIFNGLGGIMPQELLTVNYFKSRDIAPTVLWPKQLQSILARWLSRPDDYAQHRQKFVWAKPESHPSTIIREVLAIPDHNSSGD